MVGDPEILILDEPTIGLDPNQVRQVRSLIRELGQEHTILISTHILAEVEMVCDRVVIINNGRIAMQDSLENLHRTSGPVVEYYLEVKGPSDAVRRALSTISDVSDLHEEAPEDSAAGTCGFVFSTPRTSSAPEAAAAASVRNGWGVRELRRRERTLEDVFVEVVSRERQ
jgi:ABC-2 type transport system ATP-binding protein